MDIRGPRTGRITCVAIEQGLQAELGAAMRRRDTAVVAVLRSALAALANAQAPPRDDSPASSAEGSEHVAGATPGLRSTEHQRLGLDENEQRSVLASEAAELASHVDRLTRLCRLDEADGARRGLRVLAGVLDAAP